MNTLRRRRPAERYRRAETLIVFWRGDQLIASNYLARRESVLVSGVLDLLSVLSDWASARELARAHRALGPASGVARLLEMLADRELVVRQSSRSVRDLPEGWRAWHPHAAFFHFGTKDGAFRQDPQNYNAELIEKAKVQPMPPPTKSVAGRVTGLPRARRLGGLDRALDTRRTWRRFGKAPLSLRDLATLLGRTFGVQARGEIPGQGRIVIKTSPSGGARHPIEAYVVALSVRGLSPGSIHHYDALRHELHRLPGRVARRQLARMIAYQDYFDGAAALVVMAPVFARAMWRYRASHAYRAVLIEAGHLCQTFCLVAASLRLAPFCTIALAERRWERVLALDGISEAPIYLAGVGTRPRDRAAPGWIDGQRPGEERSLP
jgi:SagB-type dehydrogenase family enzyme